MYIGSAVVNVRAPDAPFAKSATVSLVLWSPSTSIWLNVRLTALEIDDCSTAWCTSASVVMNASIVAMSGCIMPAPFAQPPTVTVRPSTSNCTAYSLWCVSVVMIDFANSVPPSSLSSIVGM